MHVQATTCLARLARAPFVHDLHQDKDLLVRVDGVLASFVNLEVFVRENHVYISQFAKLTKFQR